MKEETQKPPKKCWMEEMCVICAKKPPPSNLTKPKDQQSFEALQSAERIQNCYAIRNLHPDDSKLLYHRNCHASFKHKKLLLALHSKKTLLLPLISRNLVMNALAQLVLWEKFVFSVRRRFFAKSNVCCYCYN